FRSIDVSRSLSLTPDQVNRLNQLNTQTQSSFQADWNRLTAMNDAERVARAQQLNGQFNSAFLNGAQNVFNNQQLARYRQLQLQSLGFGAFFDPAVQRQLNLTPDQLQRLNTDMTWSQIQLRLIGTMTDRAAADRAFQTYQTQYATRLNQFLTPQQQQI